MAKREVEVIDPRYEALEKENIELKRQLSAISDAAKYLDNLYKQQIDALNAKIMQLESVGV